MKIYTTHEDCVTARRLVKRDNKNVNFSNTLNIGVVEAGGGEGVYF